MAFIFIYTCGHHKGTACWGGGTGAFLSIFCPVVGDWPSPGFPISPLCGDWSVGGLPSWGLWSFSPFLSFPAWVTGPFSGLPYFHYLRGLVGGEELPSWRIAELSTSPELSCRGSLALLWAYLLLLCGDYPVGKSFRGNILLVIFVS